ncbi:MAG: hemolysin family protein [bacterium]|nr:hemolysin family protein [bacterium]
MTTHSSVWPLVALIILLILCSAFFSGSETALFSLSRARVRRLRDTAGRTGRAIAELLRLPRRLLITILLGNLLVNTLVSSIIADLITRAFGAEAVGLAILVTTPLLLIFGEITPKTFAILRPVAFSRVAALPLQLAAIIFTPARVVLREITNVLLKFLRQGHVTSEAILTQEEFHAALRTGKVQGGLDADEAEIIHAITTFHDTVAREIMIPRPEMVCLDDQRTLAEAIKHARTTRHSRLPVYHGDVDHIWGVFNIYQVPRWLGRLTFAMKLAEIRDLQARIAQPHEPLLISDAFAVPELRPVDSLLAEMRARNEHLAILLDEYGGTAGMVGRDTLLDALLGGVLGCTPRRYFVRMRPNGEIIVSGTTRLAQLNWECGCQFPDELDDTVAGYVMRLAGAVPHTGQIIRDNMYEFTVLQMDGRRIDAVSIRRY